VGETALGPTHRRIPYLLQRLLVRLLLLVALGFALGEVAVALLVGLHLHARLGLVLHSRLLRLLLCRKPELLSLPTLALSLRRPPLPQRRNSTQVHLLFSVKIEHVLVFLGVEEGVLRIGLLLNLIDQK